eukprot:6906850-Alexandrium_andersonii.AAC.1
MTSQTHCLGNMHPCPKSFPWCVHPCVDPLCLCATLIVTIACSHDAPEHSCVRTRAPPPSAD